MDEHEVELIDYLRILWKWKWSIIGGTMLFVLIGLVFSMFATKTYKATATLLVAESKIPPPQGAGGGTANAGISPETFEAILNSQSLAAEAIRHFGLEKTSSVMTPERFRRTVISVETRPTARLLSISAVLPDAQLAADVVNFISEKAVALNTMLNQSDTVSAKDYIQNQRDNAKETMEKAQAALVDFRRTANLKSLRADQRILLGAKAKLAQLYRDYTINLAGLQTSVVELKADLTKHEPLLTVYKSIFSDTTMLTAAQQRSPMDLKALSALQLKSQEINRVYQDIQKKLINRETALVAAQSRRDDVEQKLKETDAKLAEVEKRIAETEARLEELTRNYTLEKTAYELFTTKLNEASISVASRSSELKVVDPASVPTERYRPRILLNLVVAGMLGAMASVTWTFFFEYLQRAGQQRPGL